MTCVEFQELAAAYALGALEPAELAACDQHLEDSAMHQGCREALRDAETAAALPGVALAPVRPRADLWKEIEAAIAKLPATAPAATPAAPARRKTDRARVAKLAAPWAAFAVAAVLAIVFYAQRGSQPTTAPGGGKPAAGASDELAALLTQPGTKLVRLAAQQGQPIDAHASVVAIVNVTQQRGVVVLADVPAAAAGKDYELWVIHGAQKIPAGLLKPDADGRAIVRLGKPELASGADLFAVTLEPAGGGTQPRGPVIMAGQIPRGG